MHKPDNILIIRNDKLGDFMLAWPALSLLKKQHPDSCITVLVPSYTKPIAEICPWIDRTITDDKHKGTISDAHQLARVLTAFNFDASISLFSELRTSLALWLARIPERYGPATKAAQLFLNKRLRQKRSLSQKPEYEYNADLIRYYIASRGGVPVIMQGPPYLQFNHDEIVELKQAYLHEHSIDKDRKLIFIHAGSGGSAINLSLQQFADLAILINKSCMVHFVLTAGPDELDYAYTLSQLMHETSHSIYHSTGGLVSFSRFISICDLFISGSTGPLHIAGALNVPTTAFYPARRSATALRWMTLNEKNRRIAFSPERYDKAATKLDISIDRYAKEISYFLSRLYSS